MTDILFWIWLVGYIAGYRHMVGFFNKLDRDGHNKPEVLLNATFSLVINLLWPVFWGIRWTYILNKKYMPEDAAKLQRLFPEPKAIETKVQRDKRIAQARERERLDSRKKVNAMERDAGIPLTVWDD